jgi:hypothetical protein
MKRIILLYLMAGMVYSGFVLIKAPVFGFFMLAVTTIFWPAFLIADFAPKAHAKALKPGC